jgi:5-methyltetrahydropteroyltriglutamate--homocysteine methyltransferase
MKRSTDRILTTHVGSLIRPAALRAFLSAKEAGEAFDHAAYAKCLKDTVAEVVRKQADIGIDVISDGEFGKAISWAQYALFRLGGFERRPFAGGNPFTRGVDRTRFAEFYAELDSRDKVETVMDSVVVAPITYTGQAELRQDIDNFKRALARVEVVGRSCRSRRRRALFPTARTNTTRATTISSRRSPRPCTPSTR